MQIQDVGLAEPFVMAPTKIIYIYIHPLYIIIKHLDLTPHKKNPMIIIKKKKKLSNRLGGIVIETSKYIPWSSFKKLSNKLSGYRDKLFFALVFIFIVKLILIFAKVLYYLWFWRLHWLHCDFVINLLNNFLIVIENEITCIIIVYKSCHTYRQPWTFSSKKLWPFLTKVITINSWPLVLNYDGSYQFYQFLKIVAVINCCIWGVQPIR